ncbi:MAG: methyltransferase domain-containing protein [Candidatus Delongbacteria bacterium]
MNTRPAPPPWHQSWFDQDYLTLYQHRDPGEAAAFLDRLAGCGLIPPPEACGPVLDLACGAARHSLLLSARGYRVLGLDWSQPLLRAGLAARAGAREPVLLRGDLGRLPFRRGAGLVLSLFTSLGYLDDDAANARVWDGLLALPRPGGRLVLDTLNPAWLRAGLVAASERHVGDWRVLEQRRLLPASNQVEKTIRFGPPGAEPREVVERVKLYGPDWFRGPARAAGLRELAHWGDLDGRPWQTDAPRSILVWERDA